MVRQYRLISIGARRDCYGLWTWNDIRCCGCISLDDDRISPRYVFKLLRDMGYLSEYSKGKVRMEEYGECDIEIQNRKTLEPLFALICEDN